MPRSPTKPITPEERLVHSAQGGDLAAFERLVQDHQARVVTTAYHLVGDEMEADDVAQEVWIRVFRSIGRFRFQSSFATWLYRITVNQSMTALKRRGRRLGSRRQDLALDGVDGEYPLAADGPGPRRILEGKEIGSAFRRAFDGLSRKQRLAITLVLFQDLPHRQAAEIMKVAEKTVSWHLFKARERLAEELKEHIPALRRRSKGKGGRKR